MSHLLYLLPHGLSLTFFVNIFNYHLIINNINLVMENSPFESLHGLWRNFTDIKSWLALFWLAAGPGALASLLQAKGQQVVPPSQSQVILFILNI